MTLPSFLCVGFQKSGTTTLFALLKQHPDIVLCRDVKEPMYYRVLGLRAVGGRRYYERRYFGHIAADDPRMVGEVNAGLTYSHCAQKIGRDFPPETKLIFMMRNPVNRCYSAYKYFLARGHVPRHVVEYDRALGHAAAFDRYAHEVLDDPAKRAQIMKKRLRNLVFSQNNYATCVEEYLAYFPRENMHFIVFEEFIKDQQGACEELFTFLGLPTCADIDYGLRENVNEERAASGWGAKRLLAAKIVNFALYEFFAMEHWAPKLMERYHAFYERVRARNMEHDSDAGKVLPETRAYLQEFYEPEVRALERIMGRDLHELWF